MAAPAVRKLGVPQQVGGKWEFVNTTGDPYDSTFGDEYAVEYAENFLIPYLQGEDKQIAWKMVPPAARVFIFFILRIRSLKHADTDLSTVILPSGCALLFDDDRIVGYNDGLSDDVFMCNNRRSTNWGHMLHRMVETALCDASDNPAWDRVLAELFKLRRYVPMSEELCSRLTLELRIRRGA